MNATSLLLFIQLRWKQEPFPIVYASQEWQFFLDVDFRYRQ